MAAMRRCFSSAAVFKSSTKTPLVPFQSPYLKNIVNKAQFGPVRAKPDAADLVNESDADPPECDAERPKELPAADHFWTSKVNSEVERIGEEKRARREGSDPPVRKTFTAVNAAEKTAKKASHSDALHQAIAGATFSMTRELPKSMAPPPGEAMATLKAAASRGGLGMIKGPSYGGPQLENVSRPLFSGKRADLALVPESPLRVKRAGRDYNVPSVTKILKATMPASQKLALQRWEEKMVASMGREAFDEMNRRTLQRGKCLHGHVERTLMGEPAEEEADEVVRKHLESLGPVAGDFARPFAIESYVAHPTLNYMGYLDCVVVHNNRHLLLVDWKTSEKRKKSAKDTFDNPLQIAAYAGALNHDPAYAAFPRVVRGAIVVVYNDGAPANVIKLGEKELALAWGKWVRRLDEFRRMTEFEAAAAR